MAAGLGFIEFSTGDVLSAAAANGYLASQTVMVFADAAARTSAIASPQEGMVSFLKDTDTMQFYTGSTWSNVDTGASPLTTKGDLYGYSTTNARVAVGTNGQVLTADSTVATGVKWASAPSSGLTLITTQTLSGVTSQSINNCFSSTYNNYLLVLNAYCATSDGSPTLKLRASGTDSSTGYYGAIWINNFASGSTGNDYQNNEANWRMRMFGELTTSSTNSGGSFVQLYNPFNAAVTSYSAPYLKSTTTGSIGFTGGMHNVNTSYDGFTITNATAMTGTLRVYGLAN